LDFSHRGGRGAVPYASGSEFEYNLNDDNDDDNNDDSNEHNIDNGEYKEKILGSLGREDDDRSPSGSSTRSGYSARSAQSAHIVHTPRSYPNKLSPRASPRSDFEYDLEEDDLEVYTVLEHAHVAQNNKLIMHGAEGLGKLDQEHEAEQQEERRAIEHHHRSSTNGSGSNRSMLSLDLDDEDLNNYNELDISNTNNINGINDDNDGANSTTSKKKKKGSKKSEGKEPDRIITPRAGFIAGKTSKKKGSSVLARVFGFGSSSTTKSTVEEVEIR